MIASNSGSSTAPVLVRLKKGRTERRQARHVAAINAINARLDDLTDRTNKAYTGVAMAFAMAGVPTLLPSEKIAMAMNWGTFQGSNGLALNAAVRVSNNVQFNAGVGYGAAFEGLTFLPASKKGRWGAHFVDRKEYVKAKNRIQAEQLAKAGARLAQVLNAVWP